MPPKPPTAQFRIFALPLVRLPRPSTGPLASAPPSLPSTSSSSSGSRPTLPHPLLLFHVSQPTPALPSPIDTSSTDPATSTPLPPSSATTTSTPLYQKALNKASEQWLKLGDKPKDSWMYWFYAKGEGLMDRIEYEEWALKGIQEGLGVRVAKEGEEQERVEIPLVYPSLKDQPLPALIPELQTLLTHRIPYHRKMMIRSLIGVPFTFPFAIIPVLPNFPMFYVLWRAYSHYKAWRGATYLDQLVNLGLIVEKPSKELDGIYASSGTRSIGEENHAPDETTSKDVKLGQQGQRSGGKIAGKEEELPGQAKGEAASAPDGTATPASMVYDPNSNPATSSSTSSAGSSSVKSKLPYPGLLLRLEDVPEIARTFGFRQTEMIDVNRAVEQADMRAKKAEAAARAGPETKS